MPMISINAMAHMGFLREGSPPLHYIPIRKPLKDCELLRALRDLHREYRCPPLSEVQHKLTSRDLIRLCHCQIRPRSMYRK
jgi:hypothetical protein